MDAAVRVPQAGLRPRRRPDKAGSVPGDPLMLGIAVIVLFIAVIAVLNRVEFGRFD
jgi:hypothetical protein